MKILFITRKWPPAVGGMEVYSRELASSMASVSGTELEVLALAGKANGHAPGLFSIFMFFLRATWHLARRSRQYDVVHFGDFVLFPLAMLDRWLTPRHVRCMTVYGLDLTYGRKSGFLPSVYRRFVHFASGRAHVVDCYLAISRFTGALAESVGLKPVAVIPLGIRLQSYRPKRSTSTVGNAKPFVLYLGRVVQRKGAIWFAENILPRFNGELCFRVAGRFYSDADRERLRRLPNVEVLGQISDAEAVQLRENAAAVVMPNIIVGENADVEGFGLTALEAPAAGSVLIASRLEGIEDAVIDGETGVLAEPGNVNDWEEKLRDILQWDESRRAAFISKARKALEENYSWDLVAQRTACEYEAARSRKSV